MKLRSSFIVFVIVVLFFLSGILFCLFEKVQTGEDYSISGSIQNEGDSNKYVNDEYGFEFEYPIDWRIKSEKTSSVSGNLGLIEKAQATLESSAEMESYELVGGEEVFNIWIQNPKWDKPWSDPEYEGEPRYYQRSGYNSAPLGIFVYVYDNWDEQKQDDYANNHRWFLEFNETTFKGLEASQGLCTADMNDPEVWSDNLCNWSMEKIEVEKDGRLFVIFYAGVNYTDDFQDFLAGFEFID